MEVIAAIHSRRSIRKYTEKKVSAEQVEMLINAAMSAPSAMNYQPWHFIVFNEDKSLNEIAAAIPHAEMVKSAPLAILICGDTKLDSTIEYIVQDCSAAIQNMLLAAHSFGLGACWIAVYPIKDVMQNVRNYLRLPDNIIPVSLISIGYPAEELPVENRFNPERVRFNRW
jgi:nitroreductase